VNAAALRPTRTPESTVDVQIAAVPPQKNSSPARMHGRVLGFNVRKGLDAKYPDDRCTLHFFLRAYGPTIRDPGVSGIAARPSDRSNETAFHRIRDRVSLL
jgi:hypothetical protein